MPNWLIHIGADALLALAIFLFLSHRKKAEPFVKIFLLLLAANAIDIDHLLAEPIYDPERCGINFHPLHSWYAFPFYAIGLFFKRTRYFSAGAILHVILDGFDCVI